MRTTTATIGEGRLAVTCQLTTTNGHGTCAFVHGGERPHVGGQALATPGACVQGEHLSHCDLWTATVPGHKDVELAASVARALCLATGEAASVTAGIHVDDATQDEIHTLCENALAATHAALEQCGR